MRITLLQLAVRPSGRSANLSHVFRHLVGAAESDPPPDLVVLPAACDGAQREGVTPGMAQAFSESIAAAAREWGIYVAAGALGVEDQRMLDKACLYDPDGDVIAWGTGAPGPALAENRCHTGSPAPEQGFDTALGHVWIAPEVDGQAAPDPQEHCDVMLLLGRWRAPSGRIESTANALRGRLGTLARKQATVLIAVGAVEALTDRSPSGLVGGSAIYGPDGACVRSAPLGVEEVVTADVLLPMTTSTGKTTERG